MLRLLFGVPPQLGYVMLQYSCCRVPGANQQRVPRRVGLVKQAEWCQQAFLSEQLQVLYVPIQGSVYGFQIDDGERIYNWEDLHRQLVTAIVQPAGSNHIITGSHDMTAKVMHARINIFSRSAQSYTICHTDLSHIVTHTPAIPIL